MLDRLYAQATAARRRHYERHPEARRRLQRPVISVGNLSVGGTGKTPLVIAIARWLAQRGERPSVLSRGYARRSPRDGVVVVATQERMMAGVDEGGDEPVMIARAVPGTVVAVCEDRFLAGVLAERRLGATVHVLDDGFQHVQLARDFDVLMTTVGEIGRGRVLPFGRLRESADAAARADFVVVGEAELNEARAEAWELGISQFAAARRTIPPADSDAPVLALAGIANPNRFFAMLRDAGYMVGGTLSFADHHHYTAKDALTIVEAMRTSAARSVVTTDKDAVRLEQLAALTAPWAPVPMVLAIDGWDALTASLAQAIARAREAA